MMNEPIAEIRVDQFRTKKQQKLLNMLNDPKIRVNINTHIKDAINPFVPMKTGALRNSAKVTPDTIVWGEGLKYGHYQYTGEVYGPNYPIVKSGVIVGWFSKRGRKKYPTGRELGVPGYWMGWKFGYTTKGTHHHWDKYFKYFPKLQANLKITRELKRECKKRGLKA